MVFSQYLKSNPAVLSSYFLTRLTSALAIMIENKIITPGIAAARNRVEALMPSTRPMIIYAIDGGIKIPVQAPAATSAQAKGLG